MKKSYHWFFCVLAFWIVLGIWYRGIGWFANLHIIEQDMWPYTIVYASFTWRLINAHKSLSMVRETLSGEHIHHLSAAAMFGYTYAAGKSHRTEMHAGYIIDPKDVKKLNKKSHFYSIKTMDSGKKIVVIFPYKSSFADIVGHYRSTAKINEYLQLKKYTSSLITEVFDKENNMLSYVAEPKNN